MLCSTRATLLGLGGQRARGVLMGHRGPLGAQSPSFSVPVCGPRNTWTGMETAGSRRSPQKSLPGPRAGTSAVPLCHCRSVCLSACLCLLIHLSLWPSLSSFHSLGLFQASVLSVPFHSSRVCPAQGSCAAQLQGAPSPLTLSVSGPFPDSLSVLVCLLPPLTCALFLTGFLPLCSVLFSLSGCVHACLRALHVCVPSPIPTRTHTVSAPLCTRKGTGSSQCRGHSLAPRRPASRSAAGAGAPRVHLLGSPGLHDEKALCPCLRGASVSLAVTRLESGSRLGTAVPWTGRSREGTVHGKTNKQARDYEP